MKYNSTLGYIPNQLLEKYNRLFIMKLQNLWTNNVGGDMPPDDFLLFSDIHGLLLAASRQGNPDKESLLDSIRKEYERYKHRGNIFSRNPEEIIPGTNILLTLDFNNPNIDQDSHPDHAKNQNNITFGTKNPKEWQDLFAKTFDIVHQVSPEFMSEIESIIRKIVPFDVSIGTHNSGSYSDVIGHLVMSYPTGLDSPELALLEAILHEYNHNKLNLILQTEDLVLNDRREIYYSPYRPDARHIHGIYLGLHAIAGAYWVIWNAHISGIITLPDIWKEKALLYVLKNGLSLQVLDKYAHLSPLGKEILEEMRGVHIECLACIRKAKLPQEIVESAKQNLFKHFQEVQGNYPQLQS